ncbi:hypothetical protein PGT21_002555 [Puccinia graminis f. sp. tritici]|uniref:Uncharacterized protein n=1 Tax=Puccinia graminis f. sp. tritici TaxID=56615 RepID=A0A5B0QSB3_PUCGR|nr:hypothetical protein PGT21_002555 [Puccinia graminis f. sp. tritici]
MPHMFQVQAVVVSNPPPHPTPNGDTLDDAALLFAGSVFDCQAHNLDTSPPTLQLLAQNLLTMSKILKRRQEDEDLHEAVSPALRKLFKNLEKKMDEGFGKVDEKFKRMDQRLEGIDKRFEQMDKRFEQMDKRFEQMDEGFKKMDTYSKQRFKRIEKKLERMEVTLNHQIKHVKAHPYNNLHLLQPTPTPESGPSNHTHSGPTSPTSSPDPTAI